MSKLKQTGLGVYNNYGPRTTDEGRSGILNTGGNVVELELDFRGDANGETLVGFIPAGSKILEAMVHVSEAFSGVTAIDVGTSGSEAANGISVPLVVGKSEATLGGTWASLLAADTAVAVDFTGTANGTGNAKVVVRYVSV